MDQTHFERLGLPRRFSVDLETVEREYLARSRAVHPDFHQLGSSGEQRASLELTAALNEAYLTLKDPFRRADYLLTLHGGPTSQQEKNLDQAFLLEMMDFRERIEEAKAASHTATMTTIGAELDAMQAERLARVASQFDRLDTAPDQHPDRQRTLVDIRHNLNAIKTIRSLIRDLLLD